MQRSLYLHPSTPHIFFSAFMVLIELEGESHRPKNEPNAKENKVSPGLGAKGEHFSENIRILFWYLHL